MLAHTAAYSAGGPRLERVVEYLDGNRRKLAQLLSELHPGVRVTVPEGNYIALLDFREADFTGDLDEWFCEHAGVAMTRWCCVRRRSGRLHPIRLRHATSGDG